MLLHAGSFQYLSKVRLLWARQVWSNGWQKHQGTCVCGSIIMNTLTSRNILAATLQMRMESLFSRKVGALSFVLLVAFLVWSCLVLSCPLLFSFLFYSPEFSFLLFSSCPFPSFPLSFSRLLSVSPVTTQPLCSCTIFPCFLLLFLVDTTLPPPFPLPPHPVTVVLHLLCVLLWFPSASALLNQRVLLMFTRILHTFHTSWQ